MEIESVAPSFLSTSGQMLALRTPKPRTLETLVRARPVAHPTKGGFVRYEISGVVKWINNSLAAELPSHRVRMKVVPSGAGVEIEDIPANALATAAHDSSELPTKPRPLMQWVGIEAPSLDVTV